MLTMKQLALLGKQGRGVEIGAHCLKKGKAYSNVTILIFGKVGEEASCFILGYCYIHGIGVGR